MIPHESALLRLSPELRNQIYEYALAETGTADLLGGEPPLTRTSRQIRGETLLLYYSCNDFGLVVPRNQARWMANHLEHHFARTPQRRKLQSMRHLDVEYHLPSSENVPMYRRTRDGGWTDIAAVLASCGLRKDQVAWRAVSTPFSDPALGKHYFEWLAESARLHMYSKVIARDWDEAVDREHSAVGAEQDAVAVPVEGTPEHCWQG